MYNQDLNPIIHIRHHKIKIKLLDMFMEKM